jgi:hypothetical protein
LDRAIAIIILIVIGVPVVVFTGLWVFAWLTDGYNLFVNGRPSNHSGSMTRGSDYEPNATDPSDGGDF